MIHGYSILAIVLTSDGEYFFTGSYNRSVEQFDIETGQQVYHYKGIHGDSIKAIVLISNGIYLLTASQDMSVKRLNIDNLQWIYHYKGIHEHNIDAIALESNAKYLFTASWDKGVNNSILTLIEKITTTKRSMDTMLMRSRWQVMVNIPLLPVGIRLLSNSILTFYKRYITTKVSMEIGLIQSSWHLINHLCNSFYRGSPSTTVFCT